jgi:hypothetical protein
MVEAMEDQVDPRAVLTVDQAEETPAVEEGVRAVPAEEIPEARAEMVVVRAAMAVAQMGEIQVVIPAITEVILVEIPVLAEEILTATQVETAVARMVAV